MKFVSGMVLAIIFVIAISFIAVSTVRAFESNRSLLEKLLHQYFIELTAEDV